MVNPKLLEKYGEEKKEMFTKLAMEIGEDLAKTCYFHAITACDSIGGIMLPTDMTTTSECVDKVTDGILSFTNKYSLPNEEYWILVYDQKVEKGDLQLWV